MSEQGQTAWNGKCALGHCGSPSGCESDGRCRAAPQSDPPQSEWMAEHERLLRFYGSAVAVMEKARGPAIADASSKEIAARDAVLAHAATRPAEPLRMLTDDEIYALENSYRLEWHIPPLGTSWDKYIQRAFAAKNCLTIKETI